MPRISHSIRPLLRLPAIPACLPYRCASSVSTAAKSTPIQPTRISLQSSNPGSRSSGPPRQPTQPLKPKSSIPTLNATALRLNELPPELARKQWYAQKLYDSGRTAIYKPPSHFGIYAASWVMGASALTVAGILAYTNLWAWGVDTDLPGFVAVAHRLGIIVFSAVGWLIIMRSLRIIKSIDLVSVDGMVKMAVLVGRPLPFLRPRMFLVAPYQFQMERKFVQQMEYPEFMLDEEVPDAETHPPRSVLSSIGRAISQAVYYPFASTRRLMTLEGFMWVSLEGISGKMKLDTQGIFSNGDKDLIEMGTINR